jgi:predicted PurR-regulated permease PerM
MDNERPAHGTRPRERVTLLVLLLASLYLAFRILKPFLNPILIAVILTPLVHPLFNWLKGRLRGRAGLASLITCLLVVIVILGPLALLGIGLVNQGAASVQALQDWVNSGQLDALLQGDRLADAKQAIGRMLPLLDPERLDLKGLLLSLSNKIGTLLLSQGGALLSSTGSLLGSLVLMLFVLFFTVRDGDEILAGIRSLSPLRASQEAHLLERIRVVSKSAILGALGTAIAQGVMGGIGLAIVGIPALFWGSIMALASLLPLVGTALVWLPACAFLALSGHPGKAVFLALWSAIVVGSVDNFLRPVLMKGESEMSTLWILLAILGGLQVFGLPGMLYGPLIFGLVSVLLYLYRAEYGDFLDEQAQQ